MPTVSEFPSLALPAHIIANINRNASALDAVSPQNIRDNLHAYTKSGHSFHSISLHALSGKNQLALAWKHQGSPAVALPDTYIATPRNNSVKVSGLSAKLEHIATIGDLAKKFSEQNIDKLNSILPQLHTAYENETDPQQRQRIQQQALNVAQLTDDNITKITQKYRDALSTDVTVDSDGPLGLNLHHLPPLWGPEGTPGPTHIDQAGFGDCYFVSSLGAIANVDPDFITQHIQEDPDHPGNYIVTLFADKYGRRPSIPVTAQDIQEDLVNGKYDKLNGQVALWPMVAETALAKIYGNGSITTGDNAIRYGGLAAQALHLMTGKKVQSVVGTPELCDFINQIGLNGQLATKEQIINQINQAMEEHRPVTMSAKNAPFKHYTSKTFTSNGHTLYHAHAYMVLGTDGDQVIVRNPHGHNDQFNKDATFTVNLQDLIDNTAEFSIVQKN